MEDGERVAQRLDPGAREAARPRRVAFVLLLSALLLPGCDSLPFVGGGPEPDLEWSVTYTGQAGGNDWAQATPGQGQLGLEGQVWAVPGSDITARLTARGSRLILWLGPCRSGDYVMPLALASYDFHASITRLRSRTYEVAVVRAGRCGEGDPLVVLEDEVTVR